jgi:hypothetical protein
MLAFIENHFLVPDAREKILIQTVLCDNVDRDAVIRLGGAVLMEQHDEWICCEKRYLPMDSINELYVQPLQLEAA